MVMETGATTGIFPSDEQTRAWLAAQGREGEFVELAADPGARLRRGRGDRPRRARAADRAAVVAGERRAGARGRRTATRQVCVGSSVNSSYEDLAVVAAVLRGRTLPAELDLTVTPGLAPDPRHDRARAASTPTCSRAGARILEPACGPCIGMGQAPAAGAVSVRTFNRNFPGRSGTAGRPRLPLLAGDRGGDRAPRGDHRPARARRAAGARRRRPPNPEIDDRQIVAPARGRPRRRAREGPQHRPAAAGAAARRTRSPGRVLIVVPDDVSTGDMAPDGALGLAIWSNIPACARYMFRRFDPEFPARAEEWGGGIVVGGHNYGQGSSREQAAFAALHLGVRAVVAKSFARIHRTNLIAQGILPLTFADEDDYERVEQGDEWLIPDVRATVEAGGTTLRGPVPLEPRLTAREREILLAGGLIAYARG